MRLIVLVIGLAIFLGGCKSPEKLISQGNYDAAIDKYVKKMVRGKADEQEKEQFDRAYRLSNQRDEQRIEFLLAEGKAENWDEVYRLYQRLNHRQEKVSRVLPFTIDGRSVNYEHVDYNARMAEAKTNAADYFYNRGLSLMELDNRENYRQAYTFFQRAKNYRAEAYPDIDRLLADCKYLGTSRVLVTIENPNNLRLPHDYFERMQNVNHQQLNSAWVEYYIGGVGHEVEFDYYAVLVLQGMELSPGEISQSSYMRELIIEEEEYIYDRSGNVRKDSLGNDMTRIRSSVVNCVVVEMVKTRSATLFGEVEIYGTRPEHLVKKEPVAATSLFENHFATARGDKRALLDNDRELLRSPELPYPDDLSMLFDCSVIMQEAFTDVLQSNKGLMP